MAFAGTPTSARAADPFTDQESRRWHVSGIVGGSFMTLASGGENTRAPAANTSSATGGAFTGGGGYRLSVNDQIYASGYDRVAEFAWQAGGGLIWNASDRLHRLRCAQLFSESQAPPAVSRPAVLRARAALRDPRRRRSYPLRDAPAQGRQLGRPWPRAEVHADLRARLGRALAV